MSDEFYIGYEPQMPPRMAREVRRVAAAVLGVAVLVPVAFVVAQGRFASAVFEFGRTRALEGRLVASPYPALMTTDERGATRVYWLVAPGKHGAAALVAGLDGAQVRVIGTLIQRDDDAMLQVERGGVEAAGGGGERESIVPTDSMTSLGAVVVTGEIVDGKCHLGVMKPGEGPTHRDCAVRCLLGGLPPMFVPRDAVAGVRRVPLVTLDGLAIAPETLSGLVGKPVEVRGTLLERGTQRFLAASPGDIVPTTR
jgi:hypothetical protein